MATITRVTMGREGHYRFIPLVPGTSTVDAAECECGATFCRGFVLGDLNTEECARCGRQEDVHDPRYDTFCEWAVAHEPPTVVRATVQCAGSGGLIHGNAVDGNGVGWCPTCRRYRPTRPQEGYDGWFQFDAHPVFVAVKP